MINDLQKKDQEAWGHVMQIKDIISKPQNERSNIEIHELGNLI